MEKKTTMIGGSRNVKNARPVGVKYRNSFTTTAATCDEMNRGNSLEVLRRSSLFFTTAGAPLSPSSSPKYCARNRLHKNPLVIPIHTSSPAEPSTIPRKSPCAAPTSAFPASEPGVHH